MSNDWEVTVITDSNYIKKVRVNDCITRKDAEEAALGMTGGKRVVVSNPKTYHDDTSSSDSYSSSSRSEVDGGGILILGAIALIYIFWKFILAIGVLLGLIWLVFWWSSKEEY